MSSHRQRHQFTDEETKFLWQFMEEYSSIKRSTNQQGRYNPLMERVYAEYEAAFSPSLNDWDGSATKVGLRQVRAFPITIEGEITMMHIRQSNTGSRIMCAPKSSPLLEQSMPRKQLSLNTGHANEFLGRHIASCFIALTLNLLRELMVHTMRICWL